MKRILAIYVVGVLTALFLLTCQVIALAESSIPENAETDVETPHNGIPLLVIHIDEQKLHQSKKGNWYGTVADMLSSADHSVRCEGSVEILLPEAGYISEYGGTAPVGRLQLDYIRGRGQSTWTSEAKKAYKIQLKESQDLFGMGECREWALMANAKDPTMMKNRLTSWLGSSLGLPYTPQMVPVDVVMIGSECGRMDLGSYYLSEYVQIDPSRLAIDGLDENVISEQGDTNITGGYLLSVFNPMQNTDEPEANVFALSDGVRLIHEDPSFSSESGMSDGQRAQREYIQSYVLGIDELIRNAGSIDAATHQKLSAMLDLQSAADYWLIQEFSKNTDAYGTSSTYLYKERDGKLFFGPLWDFDIAWGDPQYSGYYEYSTTGYNYTKFAWIDELRDKDPYFVEIIEQEWNKLRPLIEEAIRDGGVLDQYQNELERSRQADYELWAQQEGIVVEEYGQLVSNLKSWITYRGTWFDSHQEELAETFVTFAFMTPEGESVTQVRIRKGDYLPDAADPPTRDGYIFMGWFEQSSHTELKRYKAEHDATFVAEYLDETLAVLPEALYLKHYEVWLPISAFYSANYETAIWPENVSNDRIRWTTSNPDVVSIMDGLPYTMSVGNATVTGTLHNGVSASCVIHVYDARVTQPAELSGVRAMSETLQLASGQRMQIPLIFSPEDRPIGSLAYTSISSSDPEVAEITSCGDSEDIHLVTGRKEGFAILTIRAEDSDNGNVYTSFCTVTVGNPSMLRLPENLSVIEDEAFRAAAPGIVILPDGLASIGSKAFADNQDLQTVIVYAHELTIAPDAFANSENLTVYGYSDTVVERYCRETGIPFASLP